MEYIRVKNCNCVSSANLEIVCNSLNIKYGSNGTGKSTISSAIYAHASGNAEKLAALKPFGAGDECEPEVEELNFNRIRVFDESYINSYLFQGDEFFDDSFSVFLRSEECETLAADIKQMLNELHGVFLSNDVFSKLREFLPQYMDAVRYTEGSIPRRGGISEFLKGNGAGFENYSELDEYKPYYANREMTEVSKWAKWRNDGIKQMIGNSCPFCAHGMSTDIDKQNRVISKVFKNSALSVASAVLDYLSVAVEYGFINEDAVANLQGYIGNRSKEDELYAELQALGNETEYLLRKIERINAFQPMNVTHEEIIHIEESIDDLVINERYLKTFYNTDTINDMVDVVKNKVEPLKRQTGKLKGLFIKHEKKLGKLIAERQDDINHFFSLAGFPYEFRLEQRGARKASAYLVPVDESVDSVTKPQTHLSWGERNAFSLVMFMFEAISDDAV